MTSKISKKKMWIIIASVAVVAAIVVAAIIKGKGNEGIKVATEKVMKRTIIQTVSSNGKIQPEKDIKISPYISGEVVELYVKEGYQVKKGDLLAKIDPEIYISQFDQSEASVDLGKIKEIDTIQARFLQSINSWIFLPQNVEFSISEDGIHFEKIAAFDNTAKLHQQEAFVEMNTAKTEGKKARYIRVFAKNLGICPVWHAGKGGKAWLFVDEIVVK